MSFIERYLRRRYARIAGAIAWEVVDDTSSGLAVRALVGMTGSPSWGVRTTIDLREAAALMSQHPKGCRSAQWFNDAVVGPATCAGRGLFVRYLDHELQRRGQNVPFHEVKL